jgi:hypothetical protein
VPIMLSTAFSRDLRSRASAIHGFSDSFLSKKSTSTRSYPICGGTANRERLIAGRMKGSGKKSLTAILV